MVGIFRFLLSSDTVKITTIPPYVILLRKIVGRYVKFCSKLLRKYIFVKYVLRVSVTYDGINIFCIQQASYDKNVSITFLFLLTFLWFVF